MNSPIGVESHSGAAKHPQGSARGRRAAQVLVEYAIIAGMLLAAVAIFSVFLYTFREQGGRILDLVAADYP